MPTAKCSEPYSKNYDGPLDSGTLPKGSDHIQGKDIPTVASVSSNWNFN